MIIDDKTSPINPYSDDNLKFRKAYIRTRLTDVKKEREALLAERATIEKTIESSRKAKGSAASNSNGTALRQ